jgi:hypothetical protein
MLSEYSNLIAISTAITTVGGAWLVVRKIAKDAHRVRKEHDSEILAEAKEADVLLKSKLEARIEVVRAELKNLEFNMNKDLEHVKENQKSEIKVLGEKIELLREQLNSQHSQLIVFLTKLIDKG